MVDYDVSGDKISFTFYYVPKATKVRTEHRVVHVILLGGEYSSIRSHNMRSAHN